MLLQSRIFFTIIHDLIFAALIVPRILYETTPAHTKRYFKLHDIIKNSHPTIYAVNALCILLLTKCFNKWQYKNTFNFE